MLRWIALIVWCGFLFGYGVSGPLYRTESLRAIIGQAALDGSWLIPSLYGEPFLTKPPGSYAAIGLASIPFGRVTEESSRLPSVLAATLTVLFAFGTFRRYLGANKAFVVSLLLPVSVSWLDKAPSAEIDMLQLAWVTAALLCFLHAYSAHGDGHRRMSAAWWFASLLCVAAGFLTKWTAPAFFYLAVGPFLAVQRRVSLLFRWDHLGAVVLAILICGAWAVIASHQTGWDVLRDTVGREATQRFANTSSTKAYPWTESVAFPLVVLGANLPWAIPALFALRPSYRRAFDGEQRTLVVFLNCWIWPNVLFWALPSQHHVRYVLPVCPAIGALGAIVAIGWIETLGRRVSLRTALAAALVAWATAKVVFVEAVVPARVGGRNARELGTKISQLVPEGQILYLCKLKDEGVMFYYARPVRRAELNKSLGDRYAILIASEWEARSTLGRIELIAELVDQQKSPLYLVRFLEPKTEDGPCPRQPCPSLPSVP